MKKKYDICVVGMWYGINYGSVLTSYALYKSIIDLGYSVIMANKPKELWGDNFYSENTIANRFATKYLVTAPIYDNYKDNIRLNDLCDTFVVGCDTLWHYPLVHTVPTFFFLDFVQEDKKKVSYASSFGRGFEAPINIRDKAKELLSKFDFVSTRESDGVSICKSLFNVDATQVLDPVFLVGIDHYQELASKSKYNFSKPYILTYILDPTPDKIQTIKWLSEQKHLESKNIVDPNNETSSSIKLGLSVEHNLDIEDWLNLFDKADFVITDSYHGLCFSLIFNKNFICIGNKSRGLSRFTSLLNLVSLSERLCFDFNEIIQKSNLLLTPINFNKIRYFLDQERERCSIWLSEALKKDSLDKNAQYKNLKNRIITDEHSNVTVNFDVMSECTGCGACANLCPKHCLSLKKDSYGFLRPVVDPSKCNNCGLCTKSCIRLNPKYVNKSDPKCFAALAEDNVRMISSSGGAFTVASEYILAQDGFVCGAAYTDDFSVEHIIINSTENLSKLRGSKYMQSDASHLFHNIKEILTAGKLLLFTGLPCQVAGLLAFLRKPFDNLITIDLICHGITSSSVFNKYRHDILKPVNIRSIQFKAKEPWGWLAGMNVIFEDDSKYSQPCTVDPFFKAYLSNLSTNYGCQTCTSNHMPRQGDLTIGDFWGIEKFDQTLNDNKGTSVIIVNNEKGYNFLERIKTGFKIFKEVPLKFAIDGNKSLLKSYPMHRNRDLFFKNIHQEQFGVLTEKCLKNNLFDLKVFKENEIPEDEQEFFYIARFAAKRANGRKIVTFVYAEKFNRILKKYFGLDVAFGVSLLKEKFIPGKILNIYDLKGKAKEYYLISLDRAYDPWIYNLLSSFGYKENFDFIFRIFKPITIANSNQNTIKDFVDYGLKIESEEFNFKSIVFSGFNNRIKLGKLHGSEYISLSFGSNQSIEIRDNTRFAPDTTIQISPSLIKGSIVIGDNCIFGAKTLFKNFPPCSICINNNCTFGDEVEFHANMGNAIKIGSDCMVANEVEFWAGDGHAIFDVSSGKCINFGNYDDSKSLRDYVVLGDHVWIGKGAYILKGSNIGNGSIVGAQSLVKSFVPNNCIVVGNPGVVKKTNIAWSRSPLGNYWNCDLKNYSYTNLQSVYQNYPDLLDQSILDKRKYWLVTGGSEGLGKVLVLKLHSIGCKVAATSRNINKLNDLPNDILKVELDVTNYDSCINAVRCVFDKFGKIDVLVNNAGVFHTSTFEETPEVEALKIINTNFIGVVNMTKCIIPYMRSAGSGVIANIGSYCSFISQSYISLYTASKFALRNFSHSISFECRNFLSCINIMMGEVDTGIYGRRLNIESNFEVYKGIPPFYRYDRKYTNDINKVANSIISIILKESVPKDVLLGHDTLQLFNSWIDTFEKNAELYKEQSFLSDKSRKDQVKLENITDKRNPDLKIQNWLITGASDGLGKVLALRLLELGYSVAVTSRDINKLSFYPENVIKIQSGLDSLDECQRVISNAVDQLGTVDVIVNNATADCWSSFEECPFVVMEEIWKRTFLAPMNLIKSILSYYRVNNNGRIINISSIAAIQPFAKVSMYSAGKAALVGLSRSLDHECSRFSKIMNVFPVCLGSNIKKKNPTINTHYQEYESLGDYSPHIPHLGTRMEIVAQQIINFANKHEMPSDILLGENSYLIAKDEIGRSRKILRESESIALTVLH